MWMYKKHSMSLGNSREQKVNLNKTPNLVKICAYAYGGGRSGETIVTKNCISKGAESFNSRAVNASPNITGKEKL